MAQAGVVRDVLERGAREGRARLDDVRLERQRTDALADLGEIALALIRRGDLADLEEIPEVADAVAAIEEIDARVEEAEDRRRIREPEDAPTSRRTRAPSPGRERPDRGRGPDVPWQRVGADDDRDDDDRRAPRGGDDDRAIGDGTVSSGSWKPPRPAAPQRVWRPDGAEAPGPAPAPRARKPAAPPARAGGISFEGEEDDLAEYMHPDDVPPKDKK